MAGVGECFVLDGVGRSLRCRRVEIILSGAFWFQQGESDHVTDAGTVSKEHDEAIDPNAETTGGRHAIFQRSQKVFVDPGGFEITRRFAGSLGFKAYPLINGIRQL